MLPRRRLVNYLPDPDPDPDHRQQGLIFRAFRDRELVNLCQSTFMLVFNGRLPGNSDAAYTCECLGKGNSTVDYFVGSATILLDCKA